MIKRILRHPRVRTHLSQGVKFVLVGGTAACLDLGSLTLLVEFGGLSEAIAGIPSTFVAVIFVFLMNKNVTFRSRGTAATGELIRFAAVYGMAIVLNLSLYTFLLHWGMLYQLAKGLAIVIVSMWNYTLSHKFVFARHKAGT